MNVWKRSLRMLLLLLLMTSGAARAQTSTDTAATGSSTETTIVEPGIDAVEPAAPAPGATVHLSGERGYQVRPDGSADTSRLTFSLLLDGRAIGTLVW